MIDGFDPGKLERDLVDLCREMQPLLARALGSEPVLARKGGEHDVVTRVDRQVEQMVTERLQGLVPDSHVVGEEFGATRGGSGELTWYVDPVDGTSNLVAGIPFVCLSIAAAIGDVPVVAAILDPVRSEVFHARDGRAFGIDGGAHAAPVAPVGIEECVALLTFPYDGVPVPGPELEALREAIETFRAVRRLGSAALELAYVAAGRAHVAVGTATNPWDVAAGIQLVEAAGGSVLQPAVEGSRWWAPAYLAIGPGVDPDAPALRCLRDLVAA